MAPREWDVHEFADTDACVSPVLELDETAAQPQLLARESVGPGNGRQAMTTPDDRGELIAHATTTCLITDLAG